MNSRALALSSAAIVSVGAFAAAVAYLGSADAGVLSPPPRTQIEAPQSSPAVPPPVVSQAPSMRHWDAPFRFEEHALPEVARKEGVVVYDHLGPQATEEIRAHLERNYRGTLQWIERNRTRESPPEQIRREAIELARDQAKLEYFERGLYWLVGSEPGSVLPPTELFRFAGHDVTFVKGVLDDDGVHKFLITYVSHDHPLLAEARSL